MKNLRVIIISNDYNFFVYKFYRQKIDFFLSTVQFLGLTSLMH